MPQGKQQDAVTAFRAFVQNNGWSILSEKEIQSALQLHVSDSVNTVPVNCFVNGNIQVQGPNSPLKTSLQDWIQEWRTGPQPSSLW